MIARLSARAAALVFVAAGPAFAEGPSLDAMIENAASRAGVERRIQAVGGLVAGVALAVSGQAVLDGTPSSDTSGRAAGYALLGSGIITLASAPFAFFGSEPVERLGEEVRAIPGAPSDPDRLHRLDVTLKIAAREERSARDVGAWTSGIVSAVFLGFAVNEALSESDSTTTRLVRGASFGAGAAAAAVRALLLAKSPGQIAILEENWSIARAASGAVPAASPSDSRAISIAPMGLGFSVAGAF